MLKKGNDIQYINLNNGAKMPQMGFATCKT